MIELGVNIDHVATVRQARRTYEPDPVWAAVEAHLGGADGITVHLREDRRHIQDQDVRRLRELTHIKLNLEMAATDEMVAIACELKPEMAMLVPEGRHEVTTEGGLDIVSQHQRLRSVVLHPEPYVLVTRPDVPLRRVEDAARLTLLDVSPDRPLFRYLLDATPPSTPWAFARELYLGGIAAIRARLLERGSQAVAVLPRYFVADALRARRLVQRLPRWTPVSDAFRLIWRADHPRGDALLALAEALRARPLT